MKEGIHPDYHAVTGALRLRQQFETRSTFKGRLIRVEICSNCHPFFTGKQKLIDTAGRVERFQKKYADKAAPIERSNSHDLIRLLRSLVEPSGRECRRLLNFLAQRVRVNRSRRAVYNAGRDGHAIVSIA